MTTLPVTKSWCADAGTFRRSCALLLRSCRALIPSSPSNLTNFSVFSSWMWLSLFGFCFRDLKTIGLLKMGSPKQNLMVFAMLSWFSYPMAIICEVNAPCSGPFSDLLSMCKLHRGLCSQERNARGDLLRVKHWQCFEPWGPGFGFRRVMGSKGSRWLSKTQPN